MTLLCHMVLFSRVEIGQVTGEEYAVFSESLPQRGYHLENILSEVNNLTYDL